MMINNHPTRRTSTWSRRGFLQLGGGLAAAAVTGAALTACGSGSDASGDIQDKIDNPSDNLNTEGMPIVKEPITLHFMTGKSASVAEDFNKVASWKKYQEMTNITIDWGLVPVEGLEEKRNLLLSGGDYPEAIHTAHLPVLDVGKYGEQGIFIKWNELIDQYMPNVKTLLDTYPEIKKGLTFPDGNIYSLPGVKDPEFTAVKINQKLWYRADWAKEFGLSTPKTTTDFQEYLKAVKQERPKDVIPYSDVYEASGIVNSMKGAFGVGNRGTSHAFLDVDPSTEEIRFFPTSTGYRELLEYVHGLFEAHLIEQSIFSTDAARFTTRAAKGLYGSLVTQSPESRFEGEGKNFSAVPALEGPHGDKSWNYVGSPIAGIGHFVMTDKAEHPVETARWIDYFYSDEGAKLFFMGIEGESYEETADGVEYLPKIEDNPDGRTKGEMLQPYVTYGGGGYPGIVLEKYFKGAETTPQALKGVELLKPDVVKEIWPAFTFSHDEAGELDALASDIEKYVSESRDKMISGKMSFAKWDSYVSTLKKMGLDDYLTIQRAAYDRYRA